jgi:RNA polymerase sigma factor (sigma-70 family)
MGLTSAQETEIVKKYTRLARYWAAKYEGRGHDIEDLQQEALMAVVQAARRWSEKGGASLDTLATTYIRNRLVNVIGVVRSGSRAEGMRILRMQDMPPTTSMDRETGEPPRSMHETLPDTNTPSPEEACLKAEAIDRARSAFARLTDREAGVVVEHVMLDKSLAQVGVELGLTRERVRQIEVGALDTLRRAVGP